MSQPTLAELQKVLSDLRGAERKIQTGTRRALRESGAQMLSDARGKASWSSRIPDATRMRVTLAGASPGIELVVDSKAAPHGRVMEGFRGATFRHPVFERQDRPAVWVDQEARPYLMPALIAGADELVQTVYKVADEALTQHNL